MVKRCEYPECNKKILSLAIDCCHCHKFYCGTHRLPEEHICIHLPELKKDAFNNNRVNLENNKLVQSQF